MRYVPWSQKIWQLNRLGFVSDLCKSWRQHPTKPRLYGHLPPCRTLLEKQGRAHKWCTPMDPPHMAEQKQDDQLEPTYSSSVRIRDVALRTNQKWWTIGMSGERGSGISVLAAQDDNDDDDDISKGLKKLVKCFLKCEEPSFLLLDAL